MKNGDCLNLSNKIKNYRKGFYIHYKFEGNKITLEEIENKIKLDSAIIRHLTVKYKKLDTSKEYFKKEKNLIMKKNKRFNKKKEQTHLQN